MTETNFIQHRKTLATAGVFLFIAVLFYACDNSTESQPQSDTVVATQKTDSHNNNIMDTVSSGTDKRSIKPPKQWNADEFENPKAAQAIYDFYHWYIFEVYANWENDFTGLDFTQVKDSTYEINYFKPIQNLKGSGYFSEAFINNRIAQYEACNKELKLEKWPVEPEEGFGDEDCMFLWYYNWVGGQGESINGFWVDSMSINKEGLPVGYVDILIGDYKFTRAIITMEESEGRYLVNNITLS